MTRPTEALVPMERIERAILVVRGHKVMLDSDLAALYEVETGALNRAVKRNLDRFPEDFMFQLTAEEHDSLRCHIGTLNTDPLRSHSVTLEKGRGKHRKYLPYAFTEQGVAMLSSVLSSPRAVQVNVEIVRAFVRLRRILSTHEELARKFLALEKKYDTQFRVVFDALRELMATPAPPKRRQIGFVKTDED